jgi:xanthosine utilization system XapX-like protein
MLPALLGVALQAAPYIMKLFDSDSDSIANRATEAVADIALSVTGKSDQEQAAAALRDSPEAFIKFQQQLNSSTASLYGEETERLKAINSTIRKEVSSSDPYVRRMRPTFGYIMAVSWAAQMGVIVYTIVTAPATAPAVISALIGMTGMWSVGLAVLGVYVYKRSEEKKPDGGGVTLLNAVAKKIMGK